MLQDLALLQKWTAEEHGTTMPVLSLHVNKLSVAMLTHYNNYRVLLKYTGHLSEEMQSVTTIEMPKLTSSLRQSTHSLQGITSQWQTTKLCMLSTRGLRRLASRCLQCSEGAGVQCRNLCM